VHISCTPYSYHTQIGKQRIVRTDLELLNLRGQRLKCSHYQPSADTRTAETLPCVIYLHGNSSSRLEALSSLPVLLRFNITLFCLDLSGSGHSDGEFVSLGYYERDDLSVVIDHLRQSGTVGCIGLWGRSMGAATALLHGDRDPSIAAMVLDSPFTSLRDLAEELVDVFVGISLPKWVVSMALNMIRSTIKSKAHFDINDLSPISHVANSYIPALFVAAEGDTFIKPHHAKSLHEAYAGDKNLILVEGDHNSARPKFFLDSVAIFFYSTLQCETLPQTSPLGKPTTRKRISRIGPIHRAESPHDDGVPRDMARVPLIMRPPDRDSLDWEAGEDEQMQKAIEESLRHVASEPTPSETIADCGNTDRNNFI
jgi:pimeloyl-ACP methyl ester carboxylesterase